MVKWWQAYDKAAREDRVRVTELVKSFDEHTQKEIQKYLHREL